jgi:hypothetical protein
MIEFAAEVLKDGCVGAPLGSKDLVPFDPGTVSAALDICFNVRSQQLEPYCFEMVGAGNFSTAVELDDNRVITVSGMANCGAVIVADEACAKAAAAHCGGDVHFREAWCRHIRELFQPFYLVVANGWNETSDARAVRVAGEYRDALDVSDDDVTVFHKCGGVGLGAKFVFVQRSPVFDFNRKRARRPARRCVLL